VVRKIFHFLKAEMMIDCNYKFCFGDCPKSQNLGRIFIAIKTYVPTCVPSQLCISFFSHSDVDYIPTHTHTLLLTKRENKIKKFQKQSFVLKGVAFLENFYIGGSVSPTSKQKRATQWP
jgi:hypothetical protein